MSTPGKRNQNEDLVNEESPKRLRGGGYGAEDGKKLLAALRHTFHEYQKGGRVSLSRAELAAQSGAIGFEAV